MLAALWATTGVTPSMAQTMTAGVAAEKMNAEQFHAYIAGIVEGLAYARFQADGKQPAGMQCIYGWFYDGTSKPIDRVLVAFGQFKDYPPAAVVNVMVKKECSE
jgi:hypothetical protein